jgi:stress response protein YsnF
MLSEREVSAAIGATAHAPDGGKLGTVEHFFVDDRTGRPTWVALSTGLFGTRHSIVPAGEARLVDGVLHLPVTREQVKTAPPVADNEHLGPEEESALRAHYAGGAGGAAGGPQAPAGGPDAVAGAPAGRGDTVAITRDDGTDRPVPPVAAAGAGTPPETHGRHAAVPGQGPGPSRDDGALTRTEEQLRVEHERVPERRARLVKYVVTEEVQVTVPLRREEVRIEYDDVPDRDVVPGRQGAPEPAAETVAGHGSGHGTGAVPGGGAAAAGGQPGVRGSLVEHEPGGGLPDEIVLHAERPVVGVEVVATERVRLRTEVVEGSEQVTEQLQREQVVVDEQPGVRRQPGVGQQQDVHQQDVHPQRPGVQQQPGGRPPGV